MGTRRTAAHGPGSSPGRIAEQELAELEHARRLLEARTLQLIAQVERSGVYAEDAM